MKIKERCFIIKKNMLDIEYATPRSHFDKVQKKMMSGMIIGFTGKHTSVFNVKIKEIRNVAGRKIIEAKTGEVITFPAQEKVRKNDKVVVYD